jgi:beta-lactam-binding protein with PASTA domain
MSGYLGGQPVVPLPPTDPRYVSGGHTAPIPDEIGKNVADADSALHSAGWPTADQQVDNRAVAGTVVGQTPQGAAISGEMVILQVSTGRVTAPPPPPGNDPGPQPASR